MTAVPGVPVEAIEAAARAHYVESTFVPGDRHGRTREWAAAAWNDMGGSEPSEERAQAEIAMEAALTAALPSLREVIAAEVLDDAIEHVDGNGIMRSGRDTDYWEGWDDGIQRAKSVLTDLRAALSAPVQAAEAPMIQCGRCDWTGLHGTLWQHTEATHDRAAEEVGGDDD